jgi:hypothetical protein
MKQNLVILVTYAVLGMTVIAGTCALTSCDKNKEVVGRQCKSYFYNFETQKFQEFTYRSAYTSFIRFNGVDYYNHPIKWVCKD